MSYERSEDRSDESVCNQVQNSAAEFNLMLESTGSSAVKNLPRMFFGLLAGRCISGLRTSDFGLGLSE